MSTAQRQSELLRAILRRQTDTVAVESLRMAMQHLLGRGKLFRPLLALATYEAITGEAGDHFAELAAALELVHTFTLVHDDLPAMDNADLRRGVAAVHRQFGEATAVLAGDGLAALAFRPLLEANSELAAAARLRLAAELADAVVRVIEGQALDMEAEQVQVALPELIELHSKKTGALLGVSCVFGAVLAGVIDIEPYRRIGELIGLAFQVQDDLLSLQSTEDTLGKPTGLDLASSKSTFPRLMGIPAAEEFAAGKVSEVLTMINSLDLKKPDGLKAFANAAVDRQR
jgi:geranylgeranyl diphosphate synthase type II